MEASECRKRVAALREQIQTETRTTAAAGNEQKGQIAIQLLDEIARSGCVSPEAVSLLPQLKRSIKDLYDPALSRGWTHHFANDDITKFAALCCPDDPGSAPNKTG